MSQARPLPDRPPPYATVVFDCDSTLSTIEGIEELARDPAFADRAQEIRELTDQAMSGAIPLEQVFGRRLELIQPTAEHVAAIGERYIEALVPGVRPLVSALQFLEKRVCVVSGGLLPAVLCLARDLGIADQDVFAVDLRHDATGGYAGFDEASPLARSGGKPEVLRRIASRDREAAGGLCLVGAGATDLEAAGECARFIAFGGVARRESVFAAARVSSDDPDMTALLPLVVAPDELERLAASIEHAALARAARSARTP